MLGVVLLYVGIVLINNGVCRLEKVDARSAAIMNIFTGVLSFVLNILAVIHGEYYAAATGLLFGFTYLYIGINDLCNLDPRPVGWYCLFVTINTIPVGWVLFTHNWVMAIIWWLWGLLWFTSWVEGVLKIDLKKFVPILAIFEGIVTAWIPGMLMLFKLWPL